jgi:hypothetical protein
MVIFCGNVRNILYTFASKLREIRKLFSQKGKSSFQPFLYSSQNNVVIMPKLKPQARDTFN